MHEGNRGPTRTGARGRIDPDRSGADHRLESCGTIRDAIPNVMEAFAVFFEKLSDRRVVASCRKQLDVGIRYLQHRLVDTIEFNGLAVRDRRTEGPFVKRYCCVEVVHSNRDMVDASENHGHSDYI